MAARSTSSKAEDLLKRAKKLLGEDEYEEAIVAADAATVVFSNAKDEIGLLEALRVALEARCEEEQYEDAWSLATDYLATFQSLGQKRGEAVMNLFIARTELQEYRIDDATATARESLVAAVEASDTALQAEIHLLLGRLQLVGEATTAAQESATAALELYRTSGDAAGEVEALLLLASIQITATGTGEALVTAKQAVELSASLQNPRQEAKALVHLAGIAQKLGQFGDASDASRGAMRLCQKAGSTRGELSALTRLVEVSIASTDFEGLPELLDTRLSSFRDGGDIRSQILVLLARVDLQLAMQAPHSACECAEEAVSLARDGGFGPLVPESLLRLGRSRCAAHEIAESSTALKAALDKFRERENRRGEATTILEMSRLHLEEGSFKKALDKALEAQEFFLEMHAKESACDAYLAVSASYQKLGKLDQAVEAVLAAKKIFEELHDQRAVSSAWLSIAALRFEGGEVEKALSASQQAAALARALEGSKRAKLLGDALRFSISIYLSLSDIDSATEVLKEAEAMSKRDGTYLEQAQMRLLAAQVYRDRLTIKADSQVEGGTGKTLKWLHEVTLRKAQGAVKLARSAEDDWTIATALQTMAVVLLMDQSQQESAEASLDEALELFRGLSDRSGEVTTLSLIGQALIQKGDKAAAKTTLEEAESIAKEIGDKESQKTVADLLSSIQKAAPPVSVPAPGAAEAQQALPDQEAQAAPPASTEEVFVAPDPEMVKSYIISLVGNMTGTTDDIDSETPLMESGIDSLASVELRTQLQQEFKINLPSTVMFNYPTIDSLADLLVDECTTKKISWG